jgi:hypothetical protein
MFYRDVYQSIKPSNLIIQPVIKQQGVNFFILYSFIVVSSIPMFQLILKHNSDTNYL